MASTKASKSFCRPEEPEAHLIFWPSNPQVKGACQTGRKEAATLYTKIKSNNFVEKLLGQIINYINPKI